MTLPPQDDHEADSPQKGKHNPLPDWDRVDFEVPCISCGLDLRGLSSSVCPGCETGLDWSVVLPTENLRCGKCSYQLFGLNETRCPECGESFKWSDALSSARNKAQKLFEYLWFAHPLTGLFRSARLAILSPRKLWDCYSIPFRPNVPALVTLMLFQWTVFAIGWDTMSSLVSPFINFVSQTAGAGNRFIYPYRPSFLFKPFMAVTFLATLAGLQLIPVTKRKLKIRWQSTFRVLVHSTLLATLVPAVWCILEMVMDFVRLFYPQSGLFIQPYGYTMLANGMYLLGAVSTWAYMRIGLRTHLGIPHAGAVSAMAIIVGHAAGFTIVYAYLSPL